MSTEKDEALQNAQIRIGNLQRNVTELKDEIKTLRAMKRHRAHEDEGTVERRMVNEEQYALSQLQTLANEQKAISSVPTADLFAMWKETLDHMKTKLSRASGSNFKLKCRNKKLLAENRLLKTRLNEKIKNTEPSKRRRVTPGTQPDAPELERLVMIILRHDLGQMSWALFDEEEFNDIIFEEWINIEYADKYPDAPRVGEGKKLHITAKISAKELLDHPWTSDYCEEHDDTTLIMSGGICELEEYVREKEGSVFPSITFAKQCEYFAKFMKKPSRISYALILPYAKYAGTQAMCEHIAIDPSKQIIVDVYIKNEGGNIDYW